MSKIEVNTVAPQCGTTLTLGESGDTVTLGAGASQSGFGRTGTVDWQTGSIKTSTFTAANGEGYFANTSGGAFTMNLPAGSAGAIVSVVDYTNTFQTNGLTISPNGSEKIGGVNANFTAVTEGQSLTFVYVDGIEGWKNVQDSTSNAGGQTFITATGGTITTSGDYKIHTFTGPGTFTVCSVGAGSPVSNVVDYLVVAGGGSGGSSGDGGGGGGGAGGFRESKNPTAPYTASPLATCASLTVTATGFPVTVGAGGASAAHGSANNNGVNSVFSTITSAGGGKGGQGNNPITTAATNGGSGGSGGGGFAYTGPVGGNTAGAGNTPPVSPPQGNSGGAGTPSCSDAATQNGGGGGGATAAGAEPTPTSPSGSPYTAGPGGAGATTNITGSPVAYAGGGGGGRRFGPPSGTVGSGGAGGGGAGGSGGGDTTVAGTANTGGGGGAGGGGGPTPGNSQGSNGGSGIVVIRYKFQ